MSINKSAIDHGIVQDAKDAGFDFTNGVIRKLIFENDDTTDIDVTEQVLKLVELTRIRMALEFDTEPLVITSPSQFEIIVNAAIEERMAEVGQVAQSDHPTMSGTIGVRWNQGILPKMMFGDKIYWRRNK